MKNNSVNGKANILMRKNKNMDNPRTFSIDKIQMGVSNKIIKTREEPSHLLSFRTNLTINVKSIFKIEKFKNCLKVKIHS